MSVYPRRCVEMRSATSKQRLPLARTLARLPGEVAAVTLEAVTTLGELDITARDAVVAQTSAPFAPRRPTTFYTLNISRRRRRPLTLL